MPAYLRTLAFGYWPLSAALSGLLLLIGAAVWSLGSAVLGTAFAGAALSASGMMFLQFARRTCYLCSNLRPAATGSAIYLLLTPLSAFALSGVDLLSPFTAYLLMGFASFAIGACLLYRQGIPVAGGNNLLSLWAVARDHWDYGRWVIASTLAAWVPGNLYSVVLPVIVGLEAAGVLAAFMLFIRPVMTVAQPLALMMVPGLVRMKLNGHDMLHHTMAMAFLFMAGAIIYWCFMAFGHRLLAESILGTQYGPYSFLLLILGGVAPVMAAASVLASGLKAAMRPDLEFQAHFLSAVVAVVIGLPLVTVLNLTGAAIGLTTSYAALAAAMMFMLLSKRPVPMFKIENHQS
jgi:O-antigen/teichoic acid export membrane protein